MIVEMFIPSESKFNHCVLRTQSAIVGKLTSLEIRSVTNESLLPKNPNTQSKAKKEYQPLLPRRKEMQFFISCRSFTQT